MNSLADRIVELQAQIAVLDARVQALQASRSWRLTAPLRWASIVLRGESHGVRGDGLRLMRRLLGRALRRSDAPVAQATIGQNHVRRPDRRDFVLVAADCLPLYDQQSGGLRLRTLIEMIGEAGWPMIFASLCAQSALPGVLATTAGRGRYEAVLRQAGVTQFAYGAEELDELLPQIGASLRYAFLSFPAVADTYIPLVRHHCPTARIIYDMVDFHALRMVREAALMQDAALAVNAAEMEVVELTAARAADITVAISGIEKESMLERLPRAVIEVLPNVFQIPPGSPPGSSGRRNVFFVGGFWHRPNSDAVIWFVESIWPRIRAGAPDVRFVIAGSNPGPEVLALAKVPGVEVMGWVADLAPLFDAARVFVAPLRYGAGVKGKVGQSLVHGLPVVATSVGAEGMQLVDGVHLLIADDPERFADQVLRLLVDDELWNRLQREARDYVERSFSVEALREKVAALFHA